MKRKDVKGALLLWLLTIVPGLVFCSGCQSGKNAPSIIPGALHIKKVVIVGFMSALSEGDKPGIFTSPLSSSIVSAEPVPSDIIRKMNDILFEKVSAQKNYDLVSRKQAVGVYSSIIASDQNVAMTPLKVIREVGKKLDADAVLVGYIYRWRERAGGDYAVEDPASVSFDLLMIRPVDGAILWKSKFEKTQKSLSENLLDVGTFLQGGGKWMKAEALAMIGLRKMIEEMPPGTGE